VWDGVGIDLGLVTASSVGYVPEPEPP
jgi:hypothetical protein